MGKTTDGPDPPLAGPDVRRPPPHPGAKMDMRLTAASGSSAPLVSNGDHDLGHASSFVSPGVAGPGRPPIYEGTARPRIRRDAPAARGQRGRSTDGKIAIVAGFPGVSANRRKETDERKHASCTGGPPDTTAVRSRAGARGPPVLEDLPHDVDRGFTSARPAPSSLNCPQAEAVFVRRDARTWGRKPAPAPRCPPRPEVGRIRSNQQREDHRPLRPFNESEGTWDHQVRRQ